MLSPARAAGHLPAALALVEQMAGQIIDPGGGRPPAGASPGRRTAQSTVSLVEPSRATPQVRQGGWSGASRMSAHLATRCPPDHGLEEKVWGLRLISHNPSEPMPSPMLLMLKR